MGRIGAFLLGFVMGGLTLFFSMHYHFVHAQDGWHTIRKTTTRFSETIVDIRQFGPNEWLDHPGLAAAIIQAEKTELLGPSVGNTILQPFRETINGVRAAIELPTSQ